MNWINRVEKAKKYILNKTKFEPEIGLILGSGWGFLGDMLKQSVKIPYQKIPYFVSPKVVGHPGRLILGKWQGMEKHKIREKILCVIQGRCHFYEGYTMQEIVHPVMVMKSLGVKSLIITNASGAVNRNFSYGDLVLISDHINLMGNNPLINFKREKIPFLNLTDVYDRKLINLAKNCAHFLKIKVKEGVYVATQGPIYETPAEINMIKKLGGDLVGMSTVPEVIMAGYLKMRVLTIACISNINVGRRRGSNSFLSHVSLLRNVQKFKGKMSRLIGEILKRM